MCQPALFRQCLVYCLAYSEDSTFAPVADLPTVAISSPRVAILTERHSGAKKTLTSVCNCTTVSLLVQSTAFLVPLPRGRFSMTHTLVPWRAREDSFLPALSSLITTINLFPFKATSSRLFADHAWTYSFLTRISVLSAYMSMRHVRVLIPGRPERVMDSLGLKLQIVVRAHVDAGN